MSGKWVVDVTEATFEKEVLARSHEVPVVVDFWAAWCGPCRILGPTLEKLATEGAGTFVLAKVDTDRAQRLAQVFGIRSIPTVIAFRNGEPVSEFAGALPEDAVREFLARLVPSETDQLVERADTLKDEDPDQAESLYRRVLDEIPSHDGASVGLAEVLLARGNNDEAREIVDRLLPPAGKYAERIEQLRSELTVQGLQSSASEEELRKKLAGNPDSPDRADVLFELGRLLAAEKRFPEALEALLKAAERDRSLAKGRVKKLMVDIFHIVGVRSELADEYRTRLSRLLY